MSKNHSLEKALTGRNIRDLITRLTVYLGGGSVLVVLAGMFLYLAVEVVPLFMSVDIEKIDEDRTFQQLSEESGGFAEISIEEQGQIITLVSNSGGISFYSNKERQVVQTNSIKTDVRQTAVAKSSGSRPLYALGYEDGSYILAQPSFEIEFINAEDNNVMPSVEYPLGEELQQIESESIISEDGISNMAINKSGESMTLVLANARNLIVKRYTREESFLGDDTEWVGEENTVFSPIQSDFLLVDEQQKNLFVIDKDGLFVRYDISETPKVIEKGSFLGDGATSEKLTAAVMLAGSNSIVIGTDRGNLSQWFLTRKSDNNNFLTKIREFDKSSTAISSITPETSRRGFVALSDDGSIEYLYATSERLLYNGLITGDVKAASVKEKSNQNAVIAISPRVDALAVIDSEGLSYFSVYNEHPEISMSALWSKVWYEGYVQPEYVWQSSSASNDFEPKFSFAPLVFGTIKAAFYAMLFAIPIGVLAGAYTAYFMTPGLRQIVKPTVEIMAALPTVILGFLAGLWLAPFVENNLAGMFCLPIILFIFIVLISFFWRMLPKSVRNKVPEGAEVVILVPLLMFLVWFSFQIGPVIENILFNGDTRTWISSKDGLNVTFDQRNSIIIGIAMGIAVIPNIFSITEDAVFSVPRSLTSGSLALGATPWQTMVKVVILTASPGIFSAIMIGLGRAIGETMIVLMATGNTPIMDFNIFEGMRTLAANIAVEMPEAERGSTHFRLLFLSAFSLFILTFIFNTMSEVISHRLRNKYSNM